MNRLEFLHCHTCIHCSTRVSRDMAHVTISLCDMFRWPTYKTDCPHYKRATWHDGHHLESYLGELDLLEKRIFANMNERRRNEPLADVVTGEPVREGQITFSSDKMAAIWNCENFWRHLSWFQLGLPNESVKMEFNFATDAWESISTIRMPVSGEICDMFGGRVTIKLNRASGNVVEIRTFADKKIDITAKNGVQTVHIEADIEYATNGKKSWHLG